MTGEGGESRANRAPELTEAQARIVNALLFSTYPAYRDRASRQEVQNCLLAIWRKAPPSFADFAKLFQAEASKEGLASSNILVLIEWGSLLLQECARNVPLWEEHGISLVTAHALLLELLVAVKAKVGTKKSAFVVTRRALRRLFKDEATRTNRIERVVSHLAAKGQLGCRSAVLLGVVAGVCARLLQASEPNCQLNGATPSPLVVLEGLKSHYYTFWVREIVGSRSIVPQHIANAFHDFFVQFVSLEDLEKEIIPALEKSLLRAPEVVLNDLISPLINPLPLSLDLSSILADHLLKPLLANLKSTNGDIRSGALKAFGTLLGRCRNDASLNYLMDETLKPLTTSKVPSVDLRVSYAKVLDVLPSSESRAVQICVGISAIVLKEPNEVVIAAEVRTLTTHLITLVSQDSADAASILPAFTKGLNDKKPTTQKLWALGVGRLLWAIKDNPVSPSSTVIFDTLLPKLLDLFNETALNPIPAVQTGLITVAYIVTGLLDILESLDNKNLKALLSKSKVVEEALAYGPKPSFLLNHKVYSKVTGKEDVIWLVRALATCTLHIISKDSESAVCIGWAQAWLYIALAPSVDFEVRRLSVKALSSQYQQHSAIVPKILIRGLWAWVRSLYLDMKDSPACLSQAGPEKLAKVLHDLWIPPEGTAEKGVLHTQIHEDQLLDLLVLCRPELLPRMGWIDLCLSLHQDPGSLVSKNAKRCMETVTDVLETNSSSDRPLEIFDHAAYNSFAELAFIAPDSIVPLLVDQIKSDLNLEEFQSYGPQDFAIARTPEGTTFVDVLNKKGSVETLDKGSSDYELLKWEAEVRAQQAAKRGHQKKLTSDEQGKVNAQLSKEAEIRERVHVLERRIQRGIGTIRALALGPPTDAEMWMSQALEVLINIIEAGVGLLVGESAGEAFIACANLVTSRLGPLRQFIGVATLRSLGSSHLPSYLLQESLGGR